MCDVQSANTISVQHLHHACQIHEGDHGELPGAPHHKHLNAIPSHNINQIFLFKGILQPNVLARLAVHHTEAGDRWLLGRSVVAVPITKPIPITGQSEQYQLLIPIPITGQMLIPISGQSYQYQYQ